MTWGALYFYYKCPECGKLFKYAIDLIPEFGDDFGKCPALPCDGDLISRKAPAQRTIFYMKKLNK